MSARAGEQRDAPDEVCDCQAAQPSQVISVLGRPKGVTDMPTIPSAVAEFLTGKRIVVAGVSRTGRAPAELDAAPDRGRMSCSRDN
jgi:hypothetical protein